MKTYTSLFEFASFPNWSNDLKELATLAKSEKWNKGNEQYWILENYLKELFAFILRNQKDALTFNEDQSRAYFATNLYTSTNGGYEMIFALFFKSETESEPPYAFDKWGSFNTLNSLNIPVLPLPVTFETDEISDTYYPNILLVDDVESISHEVSRLIKTDVNLNLSLSNKSLSLLSASIDLALSEVKMNHYRAVPCVDEMGEISFLIPVAFTNETNPSFAIILKRMYNGEAGDNIKDLNLYEYIYTGCLPLETAYIHARLYNTIETNWLKEAQKSFTSAPVSLPMSPAVSLHMMDYTPILPPLPPDINRRGNLPPKADLQTSIAQMKSQLKPYLSDSSTNSNGIADISNNHISELSRAIQTYQQRRSLSPSRLSMSPEMAQSSKSRYSYGSIANGNATPVATSEDMRKSLLELMDDNSKNNLNINEGDDLFSPPPPASKSVNFPSDDVKSTILAQPKLSRGPSLTIQPGSGTISKTENLVTAGRGYSLSDFDEDVEVKSPSISTLTDSKNNAKGDMISNPTSTRHSVGSVTITSSGIALDETVPSTVEDESVYFSEPGTSRSAMTGANDGFRGISDLGSPRISDLSNPSPRNKYREEKETLFSESALATVHEHNSPDNYSVSEENQSPESKLAESELGKDDKNMITPTSTYVNTSMSDYSDVGVTPQNLKNDLNLHNVSTDNMITPTRDPSQPPFIILTTPPSKITVHLTPTMYEKKAGKTKRDKSIPKPIPLREHSHSPIRNPLEPITDQDNHKMAFPIISYKPFKQVKNLSKSNTIDGIDGSVETDSNGHKNEKEKSYLAKMRTAPGTISFPRFSKSPATKAVNKSKEEEVEPIEITDRDSKTKKAEETSKMLLNFRLKIMSKILPGGSTNNASLSARTAKKGDENEGNESDVIPSSQPVSSRIDPDDVSNSPRGRSVSATGSDLKTGGNKSGNKNTFFWASPGTKSEPQAYSGPYYSYEDIVQNKVEGIDINRKEQYMSDEIFQSKFGMTKQAFYNQAKWKRDAKKKILCLHATSTGELPQSPKVAPSPTNAKFSERFTGFLRKKSHASITVSSTSSQPVSSKDTIQSNHQSYQQHDDVKDTHANDNEKDIDIITTSKDVLSDESMKVPLTDNPSLIIQTASSNNGNLLAKSISRDIHSMESNGSKDIHDDGNKVISNTTNRNNRKSESRITDGSRISLSRDPSETGSNYSPSHSPPGSPSKIQVKSFRQNPLQTSTRKIKQSRNEDNANETAESERNSIQTISTHNSDRSHSPDKITIPVKEVNTDEDMTELMLTTNVSENFVVQASPISSYPRDDLTDDTKIEVIPELNETTNMALEVSMSLSQSSLLLTSTLESPTSLIRPRSPSSKKPIPAKIFMLKLRAKTPTGAKGRLSMPANSSKQAPRTPVGMPKSAPGSPSDFVLEALQSTSPALSEIPASTPSINVNLREK